MNYQVTPLFTFQTMLTQHIKLFLVKSSRYHDFFFFMKYGKNPEIFLMDRHQKVYRYEMVQTLLYNFWPKNK